MTTQAHGNLSGSSSKMPDVGFEASGLSPEEAERLAAAFKPSWELDEAPFVQGNGLDRAQIEALSGDLHHADARTVAAHAPPQRVETHEPEVSVIIDRSITAAEMETQRSPASARPPAPAAPFVAPAFAAPVFAPAQPSAARVAPVLRGRSPDESLELPASLKKSNRGLFIGLGVAVAAAALVLLGVHGATSSSSETTTSAASTASTATVPSPTSATATTADTAAHAAIPPPPPVAVTAPTPAVFATATPTAQAPVAAQAVTPPPRNIPVVTPKSLPRAAPAPAPVVHRAAPRNPPKPAAGGIVRDNPF